MSHEISEVEVNGTKIVEAMYANRPAWHGLGNIFDLDGKQAPDSATAIELAHLGWNTELEEMKLNDGTKVDGYFATVRQDTRATLGIVGERYTVTQNRECFNFLDSLCQDNVIRYESAFALRGGKQIALLARMPSEIDTIAEGDDCLRYVLCYNSHDGTSNLTLTPTSVRVVCANTVRLALSQSKFSVRLRHSGDMTEKMEEARQYLSQFDAKFDLFRDTGRLLATRQVADDAAMEYVRELFPEPKADASRTVRGNWQGKVDSVVSGFTNGANNNLPSIKGSWWSLFNALTEFVDHGGNFRGSFEEQRQRRFDETMEGKAADFKNTAWDLAVKMAV